MAAKIIPFQRPQPKPEKTLKKHVDETVARMVDGNLAQFADSLVTARVLWRQYPELVTAPGFPEHLREPYMKEWDGDDPDNPNVDFGRPEVSRKQVRGYRRQVKAWVRSKHLEAV